MVTKLLIAAGFGLFLSVIILLSYKRGKDAEQIRRLKEEIKQRAQEQAYAQSKVDYVRNLSSADVNVKLQQLADKQRNNL